MGLLASDIEMCSIWDFGIWDFVYARVGSWDLFNLEFCVFGICVSGIDRLVWLVWPTLPGIISSYGFIGCEVGLERPTLGAPRRRPAGPRGPRTVP